MIQRQSYPISNLVLTNELLIVYIHRFWSDIFSKMKDSNHLMLMCKVQYMDSDLGYRSLGDLRKVNFEDRDLFLAYLVQRLGLFTEAYFTHPISNISFSYIIKTGIAKDTRKLLISPEYKTSASHRFNNMQLPITMNPAEYGEITNIGFYETFTRYSVMGDNKFFQIDVSLDKLVNTVKILGAFDLTWIDTHISEDVFKRDIGKSTLFFMGGEIILRRKVLPAKPFRRLMPETSLNNNFATMDVETVTIQSKITPYLICGYNGSDYITSYAKLTNGVLDQKDLFNSFINQLLSFFNGNKLTVYAHNLSSFDGLFILKHLLQFGKVEPVLHNGKLYSILVKLNVDGYKGKTIIFKDSYLLLPFTLRYLCEAFNIDLAKGYFPFKLTDIYYTGILPSIEYYTGLDLNTYNKILYKNNNATWCFRTEAIKYCQLDCKCLYELLIRFNKYIFNHFSINIHKVLTLPALAMKIYKTHFMPENSIYQLNGLAERDIRDSYTGGAVDVYVSTNRKNIMSLIYNKFKALFTPLYMYDVNGLYPFVMASRSMPIGRPMAFNGDITKINPNAFGFFYCKISSPNFTKYPVLQRKIQTNEGLRTVAGLGSWTGWMFSEELYNATKNFGYTFEVIKGYEFDKGDIFKEYVNKMYSLRLEHAKGTPMNLIAKLLMNSLYGKFGMKLEKSFVDIFD